MHHEYASTLTTTISTETKPYAPFHTYLQQQKNLIWTVALVAQELSRRFPILWPPMHQGQSPLQALGDGSIPRSVMNWVATSRHSGRIGQTRASAKGATLQIAWCDLPLFSARSSINSACSEMASLRTSRFSFFVADTPITGTCQQGVHQGPLCCTPCSLTRH